MTICSKCRNCNDRYVLVGGLCHDCAKMKDDDGDVRHRSMIRCPNCCHEHNVRHCDLPSLYKEGEHKVSCQQCDKCFSISTRVEYTFISPAKRLPNDQT